MGGDRHTMSVSPSTSTVRTALKEPLVHVAGLAYLMYGTMFLSLPVRDALGFGGVTAYVFTIIVSLSIFLEVAILYAIGTSD